MTVLLKSESETLMRLLILFMFLFSTSVFAKAGKRNDVSINCSLWVNSQIVERKVVSPENHNDAIVHNVDDLTIFIKMSDGKTPSGDKLEYGPYVGVQVLKTENESKLEKILFDSILEINMQISLSYVLSAEKKAEIICNKIGG